jgi:curved DNA-binding protein CbpA
VPRDPYRVLGVEPGATPEQLHDAYRRLVKRHHPDRNGGSAESTRRFREVQQAYEEIGRLRARRPGPPPAADRSDASMQARMSDLEREVREAHAAREAAQRAAREAAEATVRDRPGRPSDEDLGYVTTDDSFGKIIADVVDEIGDRLSGAREHPAAQRVADIIDDLSERPTSRRARRPPPD